MHRSLSILITVGVLFNASAVLAQRAKTPKPKESAVEFVGKPFYWVAVNKEGNRDEGRLYFGAIIENRTDKLLYVGLNFQSYLEDGTKYEGCYGIGGAGASVEIVPRERAKLICSGAIVPKNIGKLQITSRLGYVYELSNKKFTVDIVEKGILGDDDDSSGKNTIAFAKLRSRYRDDVKVRVFFRFYNADGIQLGSCKSRDAEIQPEVILKVTCETYDVILDETSPKTVRAEVREPIF